VGLEISHIVRGKTGAQKVLVEFGVSIIVPAEGGARYAGGRTLAFGGDEKIASERGSHQPRSPSQAEEMMALERGKRKGFGGLWKVFVPRSSQSHKEE
jgi:hypothetical protein